MSKSLAAACVAGFVAGVATLSAGTAPVLAGPVTLTGLIERRVEAIATVPPVQGQDTTDEESRTFSGPGEASGSVEAGIALGADVGDAIATIAASLIAESTFSLSGNAGLGAVNQGVGAAGFELRAGFILSEAQQAFLTAEVVEAGAAFFPDLHIRLNRLSEGGVVAEEIFDFERFTAITNSRLLQAGEYSLEYDLSFSSNPGDTASPRFAINLDVFAPPQNPIPLPPAAWAGLITLGAYVSATALRRRRR